MLIEWAVAARPKPGFPVSGDAFCVRAFPAGVLCVVVDGIGHGDEAAAASAVVVGVVTSLEERAPPALSALVTRCHDAARRTRGAVMSAAWLSTTSTPSGAGMRLDWIGVGNVEAVLWQRSTGKRERLLCAGGIVGERLPKLIVRDLPLVAGDALVFATDGAPRAVLDDGVGRFGAVDAVARALLATHNVKTDDALVLAARVADGGGDGVEARGGVVSSGEGAGADVR